MEIKNIVTGLLVSLIFASCTPAASIVPTEPSVPTPTPTPISSTATLTPTPLPTVTPTPFPTVNAEGQIFPDPHFSKPELFNLESPSSAISLFAHALSEAGVNVSAQVISENLVYKVVKARNGDMAILLMTVDLPETPYDEGNIPLFVYMKDSLTTEYTWRIAYLKDVASLHNILIGAVINAAEEFDLNEQTGMFSNNFNMGTMAWSSVDVPVEIMDRDTVYRLSRLSNENLQEMMWFHLGDIPLENKTFASKDEAVIYVNNEIDKIIEKYGDQMTIVNIFNEVNPYTKTVWRLWKQFGDEFLVEVYRHVQEILPKARIIYNESYNYTKSYEGTTYPYTVEIVIALQGHIDAVGMEMHMAQSQWGADTPTSVDEIVDIMRSFGMPVFVTELDVNQTYLSGSIQEKNIRQAEIYEMVVRSCVRSEVCEVINFWGQADPYSWYVFGVNEPGANACIFDGDGYPKLAYYSVLRGLTESFVDSTP